MTNNSVTDFSILINEHEALKIEISSIKAILSLLMESNPYSVKNLYFYLKHMDKLLNNNEKRQTAFFEKVTYFCCSPGN